MEKQQHRLHVDMCVGEIWQFLGSQPKGHNLMGMAMTQSNLMGHEYHCILKPAYTIGDLTGSEEIRSAYSVEVLQGHSKIMMNKCSNRLLSKKNRRPFSEAESKRLIPFEI
jgi:predicted ATPase with chaperone activity